MALHNLARVVSATTGTGTLTLGAAVSGFLLFADAGVADGETVTYAIRDGANSEIGRGVYTTSGTTLTRASILESTNGGAAINCSGSQEVFITVSAEDIRLVQIVNTQTGAVATGTTVIPFDDTIPQNTEGDEYMTLAITPKSASNILYIDVTVQIAYSVAAWLAVALFQDSTANALAAIVGYQTTAGGALTQTFRHKMTAGTTSATTFKVRAGGQVAGTTTFNGQNTGRIYGGVMASSITITEVLP